MATRTDWIVDNLSAATQAYLTPDQLLAISGDDTVEHPGIDANNRLIWGQVFLWPEALEDWRVLWNDSQVFETMAGYETFKQSFWNHYTVWQDTAVCVPGSAASSHKQ